MTDAHTQPGRELFSLAAGSEPVATYNDASGLAAELSPRPFLHPVRTLHGTAVTACLPEDHPWHLGVSVAVQDVAGVNFWGGRTYVRDRGYVWLDDHGAVRHVRWHETAGDALDEELGWYGPGDTLKLSERRTVRCTAVADISSGWVLDFTFALRNVTGSPIELGSPATNGRAGGGYGGFFWRLPWPRGGMRVFTPTAEGEADVHAGTADWLAVSADAGGSGAPYTLVFTAADRRTRDDPWFVRVADYPGVGSSLAVPEPLAVPAGGRLSRSLRVHVVDGARSKAGVGELLAATDARGNQGPGGA